jgi:leucyl aminopeptidase
MTTFEASSGSPTDVAAELLIVPFFSDRVPGPGFQEVAKALGADLVDTLAENHVTGRVGESLLVPTLGRLKATTVLLLGLGPKGDAGTREIRNALLKVGRRASQSKTVATTVHQVGRSAGESACAVAEGITLGGYRFDRYKERPIDEDSKERSALKRLVAVGGRDEAEIEAGMKRGRILAESANWARDMVNTPALDATPDALAREARAMASKVGLTCKVWTKAQLERGGFGGILGVGAGSVNDPRLVELTYSGGKVGATPIAITGKGITFDSGGLSIKDSGGMETMKDDMSGGAAALGAMRAIALLKPKANVIAAIPFAENMPSGSAIRPGDVLRHRGGKTSEVLNTDAEGRLVLADVLAFLAEKKPAAIIDSATLTGAVMVALGSDLWGVMGNDPALVRGLLKAGDDSGEPGWELPLWKDYRRNIESTVADVKNIGPRWGGAITAGLFLQEFVGDVPWAHLDVAATAFAEAGSLFWPRGATGAPMRTVVRYVEDWAASQNGARTGSRSRTSRSGSGARKTG